VLIHVVDFSGKTDIEGETTEGHDPREDIDFLEEELDEWYLDVLEKGLEKFETRYHGADAAIEKELAEQMSAFGIDKDRMKQVILAEGLELDPETWDDADKAELAREIRKRTKPMVVAANKMDTPEAQANWGRRLRRIRTTTTSRSSPRALTRKKPLKMRTRRASSTTPRRERLRYRR